LSLTDRAFCLYDAGMELREGTLVTDEVRLLKPLPTASGNKVWLADQLDWRKKVVVKLLSGVKAKDDDVLARFLEGAAQAQELESEHVARVFDFGVTDNFIPFVVMDRLKGEALSARLKRTERLEPRDVGEVVSQVAEALGAAHELGLVHLGIEPDNIFLCEAKGSLKIKVLGFGSACMRTVDRANEFVSPELYLSKKPDHRADLWSLGAVTYRSLTGQVPIDAAKRRLMQWSFDPPSEMWLADVPAEVDAWFSRALHKDPDKRFESADEMATALLDLIPGLEHLVMRGKEPGTSVVPVVEVGGDTAPAAQQGDVVVQDMSDDAPGITIDMDD
jgi:serine/threonine-protein kinase